MFLERSLNDPPPPHFKHPSLLPPPHPPPLPPLNILIVHMVKSVCECSNIFLCQEISSSRTFSYVKKFCVPSYCFRHRKQLLFSELVRLEVFKTFMDFQFKFLPIDIMHRNRISSSRKKLGKTKSINFSFNFVLSLNRLCTKSAPEHIIIRQSSLGAHHFCYFCGNYCPGFLSAQDPTILLFLSENNASDHITFGWDFPGPTIFKFSR